jgi:hypothetical protein
MADATDPTGRHAWEERLLAPLHEGGGAAAREALGPQYAKLWPDTEAQGWSVGLAPGALDLEQARAAIEAGLRARLPADDAAHLAERLRVVPQPFSDAELRVVQKELEERLIAADWRVAWGAGVVPSASGEYRVEVTLYDDSTPEVIAQATVMLDAFGDRARLVLRPGRGATPAR